jgi:hypothetical protein
MDEFTPEALAASPAAAIPFDGRDAELAEIVGILEQSLERIEALGLPLAAALLDHAVSVARRQMTDSVFGPKGAWPGRGRIDR